MSNKTQYQVGFQIPLTLSLRARVAAFVSLAAEGQASLVEEEGRKERILSLYLTDRKQADKMYRLFQSISFTGARVFRRVHREQDWSVRWKEGWKPFSLTRQIQVIPLFQEDRHCPAGKTAVYLDTTNAFGTGLHETTRFTARIIERLAGKFTSFLDVGTGSGLLAIIALKHGAQTCVGIDIDPGAVKVARQNLKANNLTCELKACDVKEFNPSRSFDLVAANLVSLDLIVFRDRILSFVRPGGCLVVSGVSLKNIKRVEKAFTQAGVKTVSIIKGREWSAMLFRVA
ncbi:MAG: 50S ribosomal protein L11 methyltransferase [Candidatus Omnitrophica bacterium]|nr:50S ribosomal protein L11 methyltransferase [Candidatus Omnitrophota bacterium]